MRLVALTETVPLPAGTMTVADVAVALTTCAALPPKEMAAFSRPNPPMATSAPGAASAGEIDVTSGHDHPPAIGLPRPVAGS
jgi:hypothetical protein